VARPTIRAASIDDLEGIPQADHLARHGDVNRAEMLRQCVTRGECQVCLSEGHVAGFVVVKAAHFFGRYFTELLMVDPLCRRSGLGRALLRAAVRSTASDKVFTSTNASNTAMRSLLTAEGWSFSGQLDARRTYTPCAEIRLIVQQPRVFAASGGTAGP
jgi:ribosomal protein S18 acetylase RimI-like enzyme